MLKLAFLIFLVPTLAFADPQSDATRIYNLGKLTSDMMASLEVCAASKDAMAQEIKKLKDELAKLKSEKPDGGK